MTRITFTALTAATIALVACSNTDDDRAVRLTGGNPHRGEAAIFRLGCGACHEIPGVPGARGHVGPDLEDVASRAYLAGYIPNTPENMRAWIQHPRRFRDPTAMPELGVGERDARDVVAYLYTLR